MTLDLNQPYTTQDVADLLASKDDSRNRQIRVSTAGLAYLSDDVGNRNLDGVAFRFETFSAGTGHVGDEGRSDIQFVGRIEKALRANWPNPTRSYLDFF